MKLRNAVTIHLGVGLAALVLSGSAAAEVVTATEVETALEQVDGLLGETTEAPLDSTATAAVVATTEAATIEVPRDAAEGVTLAADGAAPITVTPPSAEQARDAKEIEPGVVAYSGTNGSATAAQVTDLGVRMITIIESAQAPETFTYKLAVPAGAKVIVDENGGARVVNADGEVQAHIAKPWAKDKNDQDLETWFTTDGNTLTQHVPHKNKEVAYPVSADPAIAAVAGAVAWVAYGCAWSAAGDLVWSGLKWAIIRGEWWARQRVNSAVDACLQNAVFGPFGRVVPWWLKSQVINHLRWPITNYLLWAVRVR
jgi:hypothetical protein